MRQLAHRTFPERPTHQGRVKNGSRGECPWRGWRGRGGPSPPEAFRRSGKAPRAFRGISDSAETAHPSTQEKLTHLPHSHEGTAHPPATLRRKGTAHPPSAQPQWESHSPGSTHPQGAAIPPRGKAHPHQNPSNRLLFLQLHAKIKRRNTRKEGRHAYP